MEVSCPMSTIYEWNFRDTTLESRVMPAERGTGRDGRGEDDRSVGYVETVVLEQRC